jgi:hypothetical protein
MILKTEFYTIMDRAIAIKRDKYQRWPVHVVAQAGKVFHKSGELMKAASEYKYEKAEGLEQSKEQHDAMETLCLETIATCLRFLEKKRPFSHPDLPAVQPDPELQQAIDYQPPMETTEGMDHYIKHLGVPDEVGRFTTEDVSAFQTTTEEIVVDGVNKLLVTHVGPEKRFPGNQDFIKAFQTGNVELVPETPFPDVLDEITPEQLEQAALLLDEPDHTFTEKNPE